MCIRDSLWLVLRPLRGVAGRNETMGAELLLVRAVLYRHVTAIRGRLPASAIGALKSHRNSDATLLLDAERMRQKIQPLVLGINRGADPRVNLLIPTID